MARAPLQQTQSVSGCDYNYLPGIRNSGTLGRQNGGASACSGLLPWRWCYDQPRLRYLSFSFIDCDYTGGSVGEFNSVLVVPGCNIVPARKLEPFSHIRPRFFNDRAVRFRSVSLVKLRNSIYRLHVLGRELLQVGSGLRASRYAKYCPRNHENGSHRYGTPNCCRTISLNCQFRGQYTQFPSLDPLPSACGPAFEAIEAGRGGAPDVRRSASCPRAAAAAVLTDLRDLVLRHAAGQEAGPVGDPAAQRCGLDQGVVAPGQMGSGARPASGLRTRRARTGMSST